ncbi:MAG: efflux RND transporter permease subunit, partial [Ignavibacteriaceae bacterium]
VIITGGLEREILVEVDLQKLKTYNLSFSDLASALRTSNVNLPAGSIMKGLFRYSLRTIGEFQSVDEIAKTIVKRNSDGSVIYLNDVAHLKESFKERTGLTRFNGAETVGLLINKEPESNTVDISERVRYAASFLQKEYPEYDIQIVSDYSKFIIDSIKNVEQEVYYGGILAFLVLFFFLKSIRSILIIGITIPASLFITMLLMYLFNISFNIISLAGIAVGIGMLMDNAIIVVENVTRYREMGLSVRESALRGSNEVSMPIVASTLTTMAVFLPLIFMKGIAGELFKDQSYAVIFSLAASIITALTLIPMLASRERKKKLNKNQKLLMDKILFIKLPENRGLFFRMYFWLRFPLIVIIKSILFVSILIYKKLSEPISKYFNYFFIRVDSFMEKVINKYERLLLWSLNNKRKVLLIMIVLVFFTILAAIDIKKEFIPESEEDEFTVELIFPTGTSLEGNSVISSEIENAVLKIKGVKSVISNIGRTNESDVLNKDQNSIDKTEMNVKLTSYKDFYNIREKTRLLLEEVKRINYSFRHIETAYSQVINPSKNDIAVIIKNKDVDKAFERGNQLLNEISKINIAGISDLRLGVEKGEPEYRITIDREKCILYGINIVDASNEIVNMVKGNEATFFSDFDKKITVRLKALEQQRSDIEKILESNLITNNTLI